jgi:mono/diheme cytochrome c family protein
MDNLAMHTRLYLSLMTLILLLLALAACGGAAAPAETATPGPTNTALIPTFSFTQPTAPPSVATAAAAGAGALDAQAVERGRGRYEALECASCHGAAGEGIDGEKSLLAYAGTEAEFISFMRSGGELGVDHQYSTNRLSESGGRNLYQYLLSLQAGS